jgi:hypothetical protein
MTITLSSIEVFAIRQSNNTTLPDLDLLHRIPIGLDSLFTSRPFIGSHEIHILGIRDNVFKRVNISHDLAIQPTVEELGPLRMWTMTHVRFGPLASVVFEGHDYIDVVSYALSQSSPNFQRLRYNLDQDTSQPGIRTLAGLDDSTGRIVLECFKSCFLVLDLI